MTISRPSTALRPRPLRDDDLLSIDHPPRPWPLRHRIRLNPLVRALVFGAVVALVVVAAVAVTTAVVGSRPELSRWVGAWSQVTLIASVVSAHLVLVLGWERRPVSEWAWRRAPVGLGVGVVAGAGLLAASVGILALLGVYRVQAINIAYDPWLDLLVLGVGAGVVEEIVFRGLLQRLLEEWVGTWGAIAASAVVFGAAHLTNPMATWQGAVVIIVEAGVLLGSLYALTRNLWVVMGFHFAWNIVQGPVFGLVVSGATSGDGLLAGVLTGPEWATGGVFGIEASWVTILVATSAGVLASVMLQRSGQVVAPVWVRRRLLSAGQ